VITPWDLQLYCSELLRAGEFEDYCPNGLQVEGRRTVRRLATAVTACQAAVDAALEWGADLLLVHHGYFWRGEAPELVGIKGRRIGSLMRADASLMAYHLPLDAHAKFGNNAELGRLLGIVDAAPAEGGGGLLWRGTLVEPLAAADFARRVAGALSRDPLHVAAIERPLQTLAWCSGAAQDLISDAADLGVDAYLSGEISERTVHLARELRVDYLAAGHHATERYGVQALGRHLEQRFGFAHRFIDVDNPA